MRSLAETRSIYEECFESPTYRMKDIREAEFRKYLQKEGRGSSLLDVSCGRAEALGIARDLGYEARGCEIVPALCEREDVDLYGGLPPLPYAPGSFDVVSCQDVMEHLDPGSVPGALAELVRVARAVVLLSISCRATTDPRHHLTVWPREKWMRLLAQMFDGAREVAWIEEDPRGVLKERLWAAVDIG